MYPPNSENGSAKRVFIGNLANSVDENVLRQEFSSYGTLDKVDLKTKGFGENQTQFAFVTFTNITDYDINRCLKRFSREPLHGEYVKVEVARESFLDRLKREREATQTKEERQDGKRHEDKTEPVFPDPVARPANKVKKFTEESDAGSSSSESEEDNDGASRTKSETTNLEEEPVFIAKKNAFSSVRNGKIKIDMVASEPIHVISQKNKVQKQLEGSAQQSDKKRKESLHKMKDQYNKKKLAIKQALNNIDGAKKSSKIIFDDDDADAYTEEPSNSVQKSNKKKLFDDEDDDADEAQEDYTKHFEIKEQFQGKQGEKLMKLQSKFKLDPRFAMDSRFLEDDGTDDKPEETRKEKIVEAENDERDWQLSLIEQVVGKKINTARPAQQKPVKDLITRFDPSREEHKKFYKDSKTTGEVQPTLEVEPSTRVDEATIEVSKEQFYKVSDDLTKSLKSENKGFSLLSMFGRAEDATTERTDKSLHYIEIPLNHQSKSVVDVNNPFKYDSSDSEDEEHQGGTNAKVQSGATKSDRVISKPNGALKSGAPVENFFFFVADKRFEEATAFFQAPDVNPDRDYDEIKRNLRTIIQRKIVKKRKRTEGFKTAASKFKKRRHV